MQFSTFALAALSFGSAALAQSGQVMVHVVTVGNSNGSLTYSPNNITAAKGDMVQFQFMPKNHTVTQSNFDNPCEPIGLHTNLTGVFSGFVPVLPTDTSMPSWTIIINATTPMWLYCSQAKHCQSGMSMVINENTKANATRSLANYQAMAKNAPNNLFPGESSSSSSSSGSGYGGSGSSYGTSTGSSGSSGASSTTSAGAAKQTTSGAVSSLRAPQILLGLVIAGATLLL